MTSWHEGPRAAFDLETTGRDPLSARIVTATVVLVDGDGAVLEHHEWLADPGVGIPDGAAAIHGITTAHAREYGLAAVDVVRGISAVLARLFAAGVPVLAYNARYDFTVLAREGRRHGVPTPRPAPVIDPFIMDKQADRYRRGKRTLTALCEHYGIRFENAHTSAADVLATLHVGRVLAERYALLRRPAVDLHASLIVWADRQAADFEEYLRRTEPDAVIERAWPVVEPVIEPVADPSTSPSTSPSTGNATGNATGNVTKDGVEEGIGPDAGCAVGAGSPADAVILTSAVPGHPMTAVA